MALGQMALGVARAQRMRVVERAVAAAKAGGAGDGALDVVSGALDRFLHRHALGQPRGNRRGERAAGTVSVPARDARAAPFFDTRPGGQDVMDISPATPSMTSWPPG